MRKFSNNEKIPKRPEKSSGAKKSSGARGSSRAKNSILWIGVTQAAAIAGAWAIVSGGNFLRMFTLGSVTLALIVPLMLSLEAGLTALVIFEPLRGFLRRAQYLIVPYSQNEPIHLITPIVSALAILLVLAREKFRMFTRTPLAGAVSVLSLICVLQIFNPMQGTLYVGLTGAMFYLVPMAWFYFGQAADEKFFSRVLRLLVVLGLVTSLYGVYQMVIGYPAFELYWLENTDKYDSINVYDFKRALATFSNAEEWGRYVLLAIFAAVGFASMKSEGNKRVFWWTGAILLCGMLALTGQRSSIFGLFLGLVIFFLTGAKTFGRALARILLIAIPFVLLFTMTKAISEDEIYDEGSGVNKVLSHSAKGTINPTGEGSLYARFETWTYLVTEVLPGKPLGTGLGSTTLSFSRTVEDDGRPAIDNHFLSFAVAAGVPALVLLVWILLRAFGYCIKFWGESEPDSDEGVLARTAMALLSSFILNNFFGTSFVIYSVAPLGWLLLGWISQRAQIGGISPLVSEKQDM